MTTLKQLFLAVTLSTVVATPVLPRDVYTVGFAARGKSAGCRQAFWSADDDLYNSGATPATVRLLGISNGSLAPGTPTSFDVPPNNLVSLGQQRPPWVPSGSSPEYSLWVMHLDVPDTVTVVSKDIVQDVELCIPGYGVVATVKTSLPTFNELVPPNQPQIKLGTDIGSLVARQNVMIYNGGTQDASAIIEIHRPCDDTLVATHAVTIPANTILQVGGLNTGSSDVSCSSEAVSRFDRYTIVRVDQPSFSIVSTLTEDRPSSDVVPLVGIVVQ